MWLFGNSKSFRKYWELIAGHPPQVEDIVPDDDGDAPGPDEHDADLLDEKPSDEPMASR